MFYLLKYSIDQCRFYAMQLCTSFYFVFRSVSWGFMFALFFIFFLFCRYFFFFSFCQWMYPLLQMVVGGLHASDNMVCHTVIKPTKFNVVHKYVVYHDVPISTHPAVFIHVSFRHSFQLFTFHVHTHPHVRTHTSSIWVYCTVQRLMKSIFFTIVHCLHPIDRLIRLYFLFSHCMHFDFSLDVGWMNLSGASFSYKHFVCAKTQKEIFPASNRTTKEHFSIFSSP